jgi:hypothetical protein
VRGVFTAAEMDEAIEDIGSWGEEFLRELPVDQRRWYLDGGVKARDVLRKLDNPHHHRESIRRLARDPRLVSLVQSVIGEGVSVYFSQIFFKAPEGGGPKPPHQDNFYFGPRDAEALITAWIAFDDASVENGCMFFGEGSQAPVMAHSPAGEPFNLQIRRRRGRDDAAPVPGRRNLPPWRRAAPVRPEPLAALAPFARCITCVTTTSSELALPYDTDVPRIT